MTTAETHPLAAAPPSAPIGRVAIIGTGMIGSSFAAALRARALATKVVGYSPGDDAHVARTRGLLDEAAASVAEACAGADLIVLANPVPAMPEVFAQVAGAAGEQALITDCASTKSSVIAAARSALGPAFERYVPGHPIAGSERSGPGAARADLFANRLWLLCPVNEAQRRLALRLAGLLAALGAQVQTMDAEVHDALFAEFSHWPHALVFALSAAIASGEHAQLAAQFSGAGLRDTTRIGASSAQLWADIVLDNREAVLECAARFEESLALVLGAIAAADRERLVEVFEKGARWRRQVD